MSYDALLLLSFGGPEKRDDVLPFLENVLRGKNVPRERMLAVAEHYYEFGGVSPINQQNRDLLAALEPELRAHGIDLPIYWGNRNWHPMLSDTLQQMQADGVRQSLVFVTSVFSSYSGCRQYREDIIKAQQELGAEALQFHKIRTFFNHPGFIETMVDRVQDAAAKLPEDSPEQTRLVFTAHSIPMAMAENCNYEKQLRESCRLISQQAGYQHWELDYQSRSGPPQQPWLEPDICDALRRIKADGQQSSVIVIPVGFVSDHMEVVYDLDHEAHNAAQELGLPMARAATAGTHPRFIQMIRQLIEERLGRTSERLAIGDLPAGHDICSENCCLYDPPRRPPATSS
ncbi:MAG: ferrochelatase [Pirellulaceae bacterium]